MFGPLGMTRTFWRDDIQEVTPGRAMSYTYENGRPRALPLNLGTTGATGLNTTIEDLVKWDAAFYGGSVFSDRLLAMIATPRPLMDGSPNAYRFGNVAGDYRGLPTLGHAGADAGFRGNLVRFPDQRTSVIVLCNDNTIDFVRLPWQVADHVLASAFTRPAPPDPMPRDAARYGDLALPPDALARYPGTYVAGSDRFLIVADGPTLGLVMDAGLVPLLPATDTLFRDALIQLGIRFEGRDADGRATTLHILTAGKTVTATRQLSITMSPEALAACAGTWRSPELDTVFRFSAVDGTLRLDGLKINAARLTLLEPNRFSGPDGMEFRFHPGAGGRSDTLLVSIYHVPDIRFERLA